MNYMNEWINTITGPEPKAKICVLFKGREESATFPATMLKVLEKDKSVDAITEYSTGELLYISPEWN